jgi:hypothetical protein
VSIHAAALLSAIERPNREVIEILLQHQPNGLTRDEKRSLLNGVVGIYRHGLLWGNADTLRLLLKNGVAESNTVVLNELLFNAVEFGNPATITLLLNHGAEIEIRQRMDMTPLMEAALLGKEGIVRELLAKGANRNAHTSNDETALHYAAGKGDLPIVRLLAQRGSNSRKRNSSGNTPRQMAQIALNSGYATNPSGLRATINFLKMIEAQP